MSFLVKGVLKRLLKQYLNLNNEINLQKGEIKLLNGHLNHDKINGVKVLIDNGISIKSSEYKNLTMSIPIMQIMGKPIIIKVETLQISIQIDQYQQQSAEQHENERSNPNSQSISESQISTNSPTKEPQRQSDQNTNNSQKSTNQGYINSLINRLLMNMQLQFKQLIIKITHHNQYDEHHQYLLSVNNLIIRNSLSLLQANLLKKIICLGRFSAYRYDDTHDKNYELDFNVMDLNMSLNIDYKKINAIILIDRVAVSVRGKLLIHEILPVILDLILPYIAQSRVQTKLANQSLISSEQTHPKQNKQVSSDKSISEVRGGSAKIILQSVHFKINRTDIILLKSNKQQRSPSRFYTLNIMSIEIIHQVPNRENTERNLLIQSQSINLSHQEQVVLSFAVNKITEISWGKRQATFKGASSTSLGGTIKNKNKQFTIKVTTSDNHTQISVDSLSLGLIVNPTVLKHIKILMKIGFRLETYIAKHIKSRSVSKNTVKSAQNIRKQSRKSAQLIQPQNALNFKCISMNLTLQQHSQNLTLTLLPGQLVVKWSASTVKLQTSKLLLYVQNLKFIKIQEINIALNKSIQTGKQIIVSIRSLQSQIDFRILLKNSKLVSAINENDNVLHMKRMVQQRQKTLQLGVLQKNRIKTQISTSVETKKTGTHSVQLFLRINRIFLCIGQLNQTLRFFPVFIIQLNNAKVYMNLLKISIRFALNSVSCISPHNLSSSMICSTQTRFKIDANEDSNVSLLIKDPFHVQLQQQHLCLALNMVDSIKNQLYNHSGIGMQRSANIFIKFVNLTEQTVSLTQNQKENSAQNKKSSISRENDFQPIIPTQYITERLSQRQIILKDGEFRFSIRGQVSQPIILNQILKNCNFSEDKTTNIGVHFTYQEESSYLLQIMYGSPCLQLRIKCRYELHIYWGISQKLNDIAEMEIKCSQPQKLIKYQKYTNSQLGVTVKMSGSERVSSSSQSKQEIYCNKVFFDYELLSQEKLSNLTFLITKTDTGRKQEHRIASLMTNNAHYQLYGLFVVGSATQTENLFRLQNLRYYLLDQVNGSFGVDMNRVHRYYLMPFLILVNNLPETALKIDVTDKKSGRLEHYHLQKRQSLIADKLDHYMKQFMIKISINMKDNVDDENEEIIAYQSQEHYFNTFFMVGQSFESTIELRELHGNKKRYFRVRESFVKKTKVLAIDNILYIVNNCEVSLSVIVKTPRTELSMGKISGVSEQQMQVNSHCQVQSSQKLKSGDILLITYIGQSRNDNKTIQIPMKILSENANKLVLSFNFCKVIDSNTQNYNYYQILIRMQLKHQSLVQYLIFTPFVTLENICQSQKSLEINNIRLKSRYASKKKHEKCSMAFYLPPNSNKDYNNKWVPLNIQKIYDDLFQRTDHWIIENKNNLMQIRIIQNSNSQQTNKQKQQDNHNKPRNHSIKFDELIRSKIIEHNQSTFSLVKSMRQNILQFYLSDRLFNTNIANIRYFVINNETSQNFLMSSGDQQYAKYFFNCETNLKEEQSGNSSPMMGNSATRADSENKIFIKGANHELLPSKDLNVLLNKDKFDIFMCDENQKKLESFNIRKLEKMNIKQQKIHIQNFDLLSFERLEQIGSIQKQLTTNSIHFKYIAKNKHTGISIDLKVLSVRALQKGKVDFLIKDITASILTAADSTKNQQKIKNQHMNSCSHEQFLRIPEESYLLIQGKTFSDKIVLIRNLFVKCKIIDLRLNKQLLSFLLYMQKFIKEILIQYFPTYDQKNQREQLVGEFIAKNNKRISEKLGNHRIVSLVQEKLLLIRSVNLHQANLCLNVQTTNNTDFSNIILMPQLTISNKCYKVSNLSKDIRNHYLTNLIAKFPKFSFLYQNLRSPITMLRNLIQARQAILDKQQSEDRKRYYWSRCYVEMENTYPYNISKQNNKNKTKIKNHSTTGRSYDTHLSFISNFMIRSQQEEILGSASKERLFGILKNVVFSNICRNIPNITGGPPQNQFFLTSQHIFVTVILPSSSHLNGPTNMNLSEQCEVQQKLSNNEIQCAKIIKYNRKQGELLIIMKYKGAYLKIVDDLETCENVLSFLKDSII